MTFGSFTEVVRNERIDISTTSVIISNIRNAIEPRKELILRNTSDNDADIITISLGTPAVSKAGIVLKKDDVITMTSDLKVDVYNGYISAICETVNGKLSIMER